MGLIPDRWLSYSAVGAQIEGTRFITFKVPLDNLDLTKTKETQGIDVDIKDMINTKIMVERIPNLGLVIDLTNTRKYYNSKNVTDQGVEYKKIFVPGQKLPPPHIYKEFMSTVTDFLRRNAENDKLIGVHCTHGLNRTGLMVCAHMIQKDNIDPVVAVARFEAARGHKMERENYVESLKNMTSDLRLTEEITIGNSRTVSTQTNEGVWLDLKKSSHKKRRLSSDADLIDDVKRVKGTVLVDGSNLIADGTGRYFMQVDLKDVRPLGIKHSPRSNVHAHSNQRFYPPRGPNGRQDPGRSPQTYYPNQSISHQSNHRPSSNGTYFSNQAPYSRNRFHGGNVERGHKYYDDLNGPFKS